MKAYLLILILLISAPVVADEPASHFPRVIPSARGMHYAKILPESERPGNKGKIEIYKIGYEQDEKILVLDWYSSNIHVAETCHGFSIINLGSGHHGELANEQDIAIAIYKNDKLIQSYSTLHIARYPTRVWNTVSYYGVFRANRFEPGFSLGYFDEPCPQEQFFSVETVDGRELSIDLNDGVLYQWVKRKRKRYDLVRERNH